MFRVLTPGRSSLLALLRFSSVMLLFFWIVAFSLPIGLTCGPSFADEIRLPTDLNVVTKHMALGTAATWVIEKAFYDEEIGAYIYLEDKDGNRLYFNDQGVLFEDQQLAVKRIQPQNPPEGYLLMAKFWLDPLGLLSQTIGGFIDYGMDVYAQYLDLCAAYYPPSGCGGGTATYTWHEIPWQATSTVEGQEVTLDLKIFVGQPTAVTNNWYVTINSAFSQEELEDLGIDYLYIELQVFGDLRVVHEEFNNYFNYRVFEVGPSFFDLDGDGTPDYFKPLQAKAKVVAMRRNLFWTDEALAVFDNLNDDSVTDISLTEGPVFAYSPASGTVTASWRTNRQSDTNIAIGKDTSYDFAYGSLQEMVSDHRISLGGFGGEEESQLFYYWIQSSDALGGSVSQNGAFTLAEIRDTKPPVISGLTHGSLTANSAVVSWATDEDTDTVLLWGSTPALGNTARQQNSVREHEVTLTGLNMGATYYYQAQATDAQGNTSQSEPRSFATLPVVTPDVLADEVTLRDSSGQIYPAGDVDTWDVAVTKPGYLRMTFVSPSSSTSDTPVYARLYDAEGAVQQTITAVAGESQTGETLYVDAGETGSWECRVYASGPYEDLNSDYRILLTMEPFAADQQENYYVYINEDADDTSTGATPLGVNDARYGYFVRYDHNGYTAYSGDKDWYRVEVNQPGMLEIVITSVTGSTSTETTNAYFYDPAGTNLNILSAYDGAVASSGIKYIDATDVGTFTIQMIPGGPFWSINPYTVQTNFVPLPPVVYAGEPDNNSRSGAYDLGLNSTASGYLLDYSRSGFNGYVGDRDWYRIIVTQPGTLEISLTSIADNTTITGTVAVIFDPSGNDLQRIDASSGAEVISNSFHIDAGDLGEYTIVVYPDSAGWSLEPYSVRAKFVPLPPKFYAGEPENESRSSAVDLELNSQITGYLLDYSSGGLTGYFGDVDWYQINATQPGYLQLSIASVVDSSSDNSTQVYLYNPDGTFRLLLSAYGGATGTSENIYIDVDDLGLYKILVDPDGAFWSYNPYTLSNIFTPLNIAASPTAQGINEGETATLGVSLSAAPPTPSFTVSASRIGGDPSLSITGGASLVFNSDNWQTPQTVYLAAARDGDMDDGQATIRLSAPGLFDLDVPVTVHDTGGLQLSLGLPGVVLESDGLIAQGGSVSLSPAPDQDVTVSLDSSDTTELSVPASVIIQAGQTTALFDLTVVDDGEPDGAQTVEVTAQADGCQPAAASVKVEEPGAATGCLPWLMLLEQR